LLLKKDQIIEWNQDIQNSYNNIMHAITATPVLISLDFDTNFIIYYFSIEGIVTSVLTQKNLRGEEIPINFMSKTLHDYELKYS